MCACLYYSSEGSDNSSAQPQQVLDFSNLHFNDVDFTSTINNYATSDGEVDEVRSNAIEKLYAQSNILTTISPNIALLTQLTVLDLSSNHLTALDESVLLLRKLTRLIVKHNFIDNHGLPKELGQMSSLREVNFSGNRLTEIPQQVLELTKLKYVYMGGNRISTVPTTIKNMHGLRVLSLGGNELREIPEEVGLLHHLHSLILPDNKLETLPRTLSNLSNLEFLVLNHNGLTTLPQGILGLERLRELSVRDNPLVARFIEGFASNPASLLELSARIIKVNTVPYCKGDIPAVLYDYLNTAQHCVNPKCQGVYFAKHFDHVKFVDFCGQYRIPFLEYLCSPTCHETPTFTKPRADSTSPRMRRKLSQVMLPNIQDLQPADNVDWSS